MNKTIYKFQHFPFHLVDPSPWPILLSFSLLNLTVGAVAYMHGFSYGGYILTLGFILTTYGMILWFRGATVRLSVKMFHQKPSHSFLDILKYLRYLRIFKLLSLDIYT
jgi:cytochrome c oxidase subunit 3